MLKPAGIIPAMITPFDETQNINESALRQLVRRFIDASVHGLFCLGTNGEFFALTIEEKLRVAEIVIEEAQGRLPIYVGAGCVGTKETAQLAASLEQMGADALSIITPYFLAFTQQELIEHFRTVAEATALPIILYNIPARTGNSLLPRTVMELSKVPNIVGIKDSSGSFDNILQILELCEPDFAVLAGTDSLILPTLMAGGHGAIAATANVFPEVVSSIYDLWMQGKPEEAELSQRKLRALRSAFSLGTLPSVLKEVMNMIGLPAGEPRLPVQSLTPSAKGELRIVMDRYMGEGVIK
ncbi:4-hydroxy-tetrahydrodipicolinate synthase [Paenibacillus sp. V4I3]|uniref:4-hydroxy-tetrahydrodipicolinate synthase n=1 Tax=unclassified Paenibacillus TaxID=185978 RepID=UPI0027849879|nr:MULTISPECIES: 4-hydroxy-tetrahydrodipicolinate synthase [unclassified Paenibacillus]MDQ0875250.1 4-hydroxy-tetrahydrodipicolinate synthase [Paenibacillus sp. V4I3]MDQ0889018.1 4-hydroxy-tetrahydrodipicolinate synthase [Paenibacillus sp. V4I9]